MVLRVEKGLYKIWNCLQIRLECNIDFILNQSYILVGDNGSGKTSFVTQILLGKFQHVSNTNINLLYINQEFLLQYHVIQAHSAANSEFHGRIKSYDDAIYYVYDYYKRYLKDDDFLLLILDETEMYAKLEPILLDIVKYNHITILITHNIDILKNNKNSNVISFEKSSDIETVLKLQKGRL